MKLTADLTIEVNTLADWIGEKRPVTILDVRPMAEREEWQIPGSIHIDVYDKVRSGNPNVFDDLEIETSIPVVTVCALGKTSLEAAKQLRQKGFEAYSLHGGMKAWNFAWNLAEIVLHDVKIIQVRRSSKGCLSYIIGSQGEAMVIDAFLDPKVYIELARANDWVIKYVTDTHIHADYLSRTRELAMESGARHILIENTTAEFSFTRIKDGEGILVGNVILEIIHTPGHTMESTSFRLGDDAVFTGDTLFVDGVGRPDLKADQDEMINRSKLLFASLRRLLSFNPKMLVFPAHRATAVPFDGRPVAESIQYLVGKLEMLRLSEKEFMNYTTSRIPPTPPNYVTIASLNKKGSFEGHLPADLEAGANRCAIA